MFQCKSANPTVFCRVGLPNGVSALQRETEDTLKENATEAREPRMRSPQRFHPSNRLCKRKLFF